MTAARETTDLAPPRTAASPAICVRDAVVPLGSVVALDGVDLIVPDGAWVALIGPNGAGKTTLLRTIVGLCPTRTGSVLLHGEDVRGLRGRERARRLAYLAQSPVIPPGVSVFDYVLLGRNPHIGFFSVERQHDREVVDSVLTRLDLAEFSERALETLSGGERQRVTLARALAQEAPVLLLDEPTSGLDLGHAQEVLELVDGLRVEDHITVLSAIHDLTLASQYADSLVMLDHGRVVATGVPRDVLTEERLARHYRAHVQVGWSDDGPGVVISPTRPRARR